MTKTSCSSMDSFAMFERTRSIRRQFCKVVSDFFPEAIGKSERWLHEKLAIAISDDPTLMPTGWYCPPPSGISVLAATRTNFVRLNFDNLRRAEFWPSQDILIKEGGVITVYVSPVCTTSLLFGDLGCTLLCGSDPKIDEHISLCRRTVDGLASTISEGLEFCEIHHQVQLAFAMNGLNNDSTICISDKLSTTNVGHTIPASLHQIFPSSSAAETMRALAGARIYLSPTELYRVPRDGAFTLEARLLNAERPELPNVLVHSIVWMISGEPHLINDVPKLALKL